MNLRTNYLHLAVLSALASTSVAYAQSTETPVQQLDTVVVTATGFEQNVEDAPASISVVPREELEQHAYNDALDAIKDLPGIQQSGSGASADISIRGMSSAYTALMIDGRRVTSRETRTNSDISGIEHGWLPPIEEIERIEVVRGPMSSLYGSDAMGGVINVITRKVPKEWTGSVRLQGTLQEDRDSGDQYDASLFLGGPIVKDILGIQLHAATDRRLEDHIIDGFDKKNTDSGGVKLSLTPNEDHDIVLTVDRTMQERAQTPGKTLEYYTTSRRHGKTTTTTNSATDSKYGITQYSLTHTGRWTDRLTSNTYIQRTDADNDNRDMYLRSTEFNTSWNYLIGEKSVFTAGFNFLRDEIKDYTSNDYTASGLNKISRNQWALFAEGDWALADSFTLTTGLRMTHDERYGSEWTPRLYGVYRATDNLTLKGGISTGFKAPNLRYTYKDWAQVTGHGRSNAIILGNPDLKPEKSINYEVSAQWDNRRNWRASITGFYSQFKDKISSAVICDTDIDGTCEFGGDDSYDTISQRFNIDKAIMEGIEITSDWDITDNLSLKANYTYTKTEQKSGDLAGQPLNQTPRHMFNASLRYNVNDNFNVWARYNLRSRTSDYVMTRGSASMQDGTPSFAFMDVGLNYKITKNVGVGFGIYNIFDKRVTPNEDGYSDIYDGRRYTANLNLKF